MKAHNKESHSVIWFMLIFFSVLAISALSLLVQYNASSQTGADFFEPIKLPIDKGLF